MSAGGPGGGKDVKDVGDKAASLEKGAKGGKSAIGEVAGLLGISTGADISFTSGRTRNFTKSTFDDQSTTSDDSVRNSQRNSQEVNDGTRDQRDDSRSNSSGTFASDTRTNSSRSGSEMSQEERESLSQTKAEHERRARMLDELASYSESNGWRLNENAIPLIQPLYEEMSANSPVRLPHIAKVNLTPIERDKRDHAIQDIIQRIEGDPTREFNQTHGVGKDIPDVKASVPSRLEGGLGSPQSTFPELDATDGSARDVARQHGVSVKAGTNLGNLKREMVDAIPVVASVGRELGVPGVVITSGNDRRHTHGSQHYKDAALDFRGNEISREVGERWEREVQTRLGPSYWVDYEYDPKEPANRHLHVQRRR